jgi:hypothetical protein
MAPRFQILLRVGGMFATNVFQECVLNRVDRVYRCFGSDPFHDYYFMTDGAFTGNDGARPKGGNQLRFWFWRGRHVSCPAVASSGRKISRISCKGMPSPKSAVILLLGPQPSARNICNSYYHKTKLSRREREQGNMLHA